MKKIFARWVSSVVVCGALVGGLALAGTGCSDDKDTPTGPQATVPLTAAQEVPPVVSTATGTATVTLVEATRVITVSGTFSGLSAAATAAHIHGPAPIGMTAGVMVPLTVSSATSGTVSGTGTLTPEQVISFLGDLTYVNIHSEMYPDGELRGQIIVP